MKQFKTIYKYITLIFMLIPVLHLSKYVRPAWDDFSYGLYTINAVRNGEGIIAILKGAWNGAVHMYKTWQGTYSSCFIMSLQPGIYNEKIYGLTTWILVGTIFLSFLCFFRAVKKHLFCNKDIEECYWALLSTVVIALGMPCASQGLYWYVGAMHYIPWTMTTIINMAIILKIYYSDDSKKKVALLVSSCMISFVTSGGNQCTAFANILLLSLVSLLFVVKKKEIYVVSSLLSALIGFVVMWIAPGNSVRQSEYTQTGIKDTLSAGVKYAIEYTIEWSNLVLLAVIVLFLPLIIKSAKKIKDSTLCRNPLIVFLASAMVFCGMICVPYYGLGWMGPDRLINTIWIYFTIAVMFDLCCIVGYLERKYDILSFVYKIWKNEKDSVKCLIYTVCAFVIFLISSANTSQLSTSSEALKELLSREAQVYAKEWDERLEIYHDDGVKDVIVEPLSFYPELIGTESIFDDSNYWSNVAVANYYAKDSIKMK